MDKIEVSIQFTPEDLQKAYSLHFKKTNPIRSRIVLILGIILVFLGILLAVLQSMAGIITWISWFFVIYGILIVTYYYRKIGRMGKAAFKKLVEFHFPFSFTITSESVRTVGKTITSDSTWDHYQFAVVTEQMILLYPNTMRFVLLPKKYFSDAEFDQLNDWVKGNVKCK
jgi:O-antigen/teichoic acid export membrane protein